MAVNAAKIRLGAPSLFLVGTQDMGATKGGVTFKYTPKEMQIKCDQYIAPIAVFKTDEEAEVDAAFYQTQMALLLIAFGQTQGNGDLVTVTGTPNTDTFHFGGRLNLGVTTLDLTIPKNDGTTNNILVHLNRVYSAKEVSLDFDRSKDTTYKVTYSALADTTQPAGQQLGYLVEQY